MFLDEILVQQEIERSRGDKGQRLEEIKEEILKKQREQKPIPEFVEELRNGSVTLGGRTYRCEQKQVLEGAVSVLLLPDDVEQVIENKPAAHIQYRSLQIGETVFYVDSPVMIKDEQEYQNSLVQELKRGQIPYQPIDTGHMKQGKQTICYATGITVNVAGALFIINYFITGRPGFVSGNLICKLQERFTFENFFLAKLCLMGETDD